MPCTPAQQALDQAQSTAFMRNFYASLGMRELTLERAIRHRKGEPAAPPRLAPRRHRGCLVSKVIESDPSLAALSAGRRKL